jgi:hypothetical protein
VRPVCVAQKQSRQLLSLMLHLLQCVTPGCMPGASVAPRAPLACCSANYLFRYVSLAAAHQPTHALLPHASHAKHLLQCLTLHTPSPAPSQAARHSVAPRRHLPAAANPAQAPLAGRVHLLRECSEWRQRQLVLAAAVLVVPAAATLQPVAVRDQPSFFDLLFAGWAH